MFTTHADSGLATLYTDGPTDILVDRKPSSAQLHLSDDRRRWDGTQGFMCLYVPVVLALPAATGTTQERIDTLNDAIESMIARFDFDYHRMRDCEPYRALSAELSEAIADGWREDCLAASRNTYGHNPYLAFVVDERQEVA